MDNQDNQIKWTCRVCGAPARYKPGLKAPLCVEHMIDMLIMLIRNSDEPKKGEQA